MRSLWNGLTGGGAESRALISEHFISIFDAIIAETTSKLWRTRAGSAGALVEIIVGRDWVELGSGNPILDSDTMENDRKSGGTRLIQLWECAMRLMDDVHGVVRENGATLARSVRSLTINLCDPNSSRDTGSGSKRDRVEDDEIEAHSGAAAGTALHWLVRRGFTQQLSSAAGICITAIVGIVKVVKPKIVDQSLPELVRALLWAMSGLEPSAMNYLQFHVDDKEGLERARLRMTQVGPLADALNRCIELLPLSGVNTRERMASELDSALRQSMGFASRAAVADTVSALCNSCESIFTQSKPATSQLIKALYVASEREVGEGAKQKMVQALGNLASLSPITTVRSLAVRACRRYEACTGNNFDIKAQRVAAGVVRAIATRAGSHLKYGGPNDVWRSRVLPAAFLGKMDTDSKIAELWDDVWKEAGNITLSEDFGQEAFGTIAEEQLLAQLADGIIASLNDVAWSRRVAAASAISNLTGLGVLAPLKQSSGQLSTQKRGLARASASRRLLRQCVKLWTKPRMWTGKKQLVKSYVLSKVKPNINLSILQCRAVDIAIEWSNHSVDLVEVPFSMKPTDDGSLFAGDYWFAKENTVLENEVDTETVKYPEHASNDKITDAFDNENIDFDDAETELCDQKTLEDAGGALVFSGLCKLCCLQGTDKFLSSDKSNSFDESLPYATECLKGFQRMVSSLSNDNIVQKQAVFRDNVATILSFVELSKSHQIPPVIVSEAISCLGCCFWTKMGPILLNSSTGANLETSNLLDVLRETGEASGNAWTVRASAFRCISSLAGTCNEECYQRHRTGQSMVDSCKAAMGDRKYWRVR